MHIKTPITRERIKNHLTYSSWKYVVLAVLAIMGWSLIYTTTAYRSPQDKRIDLYVQTATATNETMDAFIEPIWKEVVPEMETVSSVVLNTIDDYTTYMQLTAYMAAGEGDIYFLTDQYFKSMASSGALLELDGLVADGTIDVGDIDLSKGYVAVVDAYDDNNVAISSSRHLYGIPLEQSGNAL